MSCRKAEYMSVNERSTRATVALQRAEVKMVEDFRFLGLKVQSN